MLPYPKLLFAGKLGGLALLLHGLIGANEGSPATKGLLVLGALLVVICVKCSPARKSG
ncbi:hypothetical protein LG047_13310 [Methylocystis sp. WRRC1]|uniref:hypothetical protein n=1 Tax=Methylocystis sp. WRRC1 TaxID=1732014 RepID=UPI001D1353A5|nr:hypothetical protein [Methylocystis sp. WRRC1]MCC3246286.1 hypothetical protein [Methylocystis sp. WRRC1]